MFAIGLIQRFEELRDIGLVRSKRDFSRRWLERGSTYLRDYEHRDRDWIRVSPSTSARLRAHLIAIADVVPIVVSNEIRAVVAAIDRDEKVAVAMAEWGR